MDRTKSGMNALDWALFNEKEDVVKLLRSLGAKRSP